MRRALLASLLVPLLLPAAGATLPPPVHGDIDPFGGPIAPLAAAATTTVRLTGGCEGEVSLRVARAPAWAVARVSPATLRLDRCDGHAGAGEATLSVTLDASAPAFRPAEIVIEHNAPYSGGEHVVEVVADYFSILEVSAPAPIVEVKPGETARIHVEVVNRGNGATWVALELQDAGGDLAPAPIAPFRLESAQQGGTETARNLTIEVVATAGGGYVNQVGTVNYRVRSWSAENETRAGDATTLSLLVTQKGLGAPGPAPLALVVLAGLAALVLRRRA